MSPETREDTPAAIRGPRASGDEPGVPFLIKNNLLWSPRERG